MNRRNLLSLSVATALGLALLSGGAVAQSIKEQIIGTWAFVSALDVKADGTKTSC